MIKSFFSYFLRFCKYFRQRRSLFKKRYRFSASPAEIVAMQKSRFFSLPLAFCQSREKARPPRPSLNLIIYKYIRFVKSFSRCLKQIHIFAACIESAMRHSDLHWFLFLICNMAFNIIIKSFYAKKVGHAARPYFACFYSFFENVRYSHAGFSVAVGICTVRHFAVFLGIVKQCRESA